MNKAKKLFYTALLGLGLSILNPAKVLGHGFEIDTHSIKVNQKGSSFAIYNNNRKNPLFNFYANNPEESVASYGLEVDAPVEEVPKENNQFSIQFKFHRQSDPLQEKTLTKGGVSLDSKYKNIDNKLEIKAGSLAVEDKIQSFLGQETPGQNLVGIEDNIDVSVYDTKKLKANIGAAVSGVMSQIKDKWDYDNHGLGIHGSCSANLSKKVNTMIKAMTESYNLNKSKYFFLDKISKSELSTLLNWKPNKNININLFNLLQNEINEKELYKITNGLEFSFKDFLAKLILTDIPTEKINQKTISLGIHPKNWGLELYLTALTSPKEWKNENIAGINLNVGFGRDSKDLANTNIYIPQYKVNNLSFDELSEDLDTIQKQIRWTNTNIDYKTGLIFPDRTPEEVYSDRGGDCDELSDFVSLLATKHGYEAYTLFDYRESGTSHAVALLANKRGEIFLVNNAGVPEKVDVDPNVSLTEKAKEAVLQFNEYFNIREGDWVDLHMWKWYQDPNGKWKQKFEFDVDEYWSQLPIWDYKSKETNHIKRETGVKALIGDAF